MIPKVYIIDDDLVSQFATLYAVKKNCISFEVVTFDNATEALEIIKKDISSKKYKLTIVLDLVMPIVDGWDFLDQLKAYLLPEVFIKIFILSSFRNSSDREKAKMHPLIQGFFDKPLSQLNAQKILIDAQ
ncbi:response regulator [Cellulophaga sp. Hel_I_12]|uniref:response regulator n=1 Tax=Cellulophaga sp. Hel_I_12 TaxID=1249972 RepID=UPI000646302B|nr:response regulator [Cellulophaga sp. Hel_I_12]